MAKKLFFLGIFFLFLGFINTSDLNLMRLQPAGIAVLVEHNNWDLNQLTQSQFQELGDTYDYENKSYALKAPGLFIVGMPIYYILDFFNLTFSYNWQLVVSILTIFLAIIPAVIILRLIFVIVEDSESKKYLYILFLALGTMLFSYSNVLSHDLLALLCLVTSYYFYCRRKEDNFWQGFLAGLAMFFSYKFIVPAIIFAVYYLKQKRELMVLGGFVLGVSLLLLWQQLMFGGFWITPHYLASPNLDVFPKYWQENFWNKLVFYLLSPQTSIWANNLLLIPAFIGLILNYKRKNNLFIIFFSFIYLTYLLFLGTVGDCQYPPRYLMVLVPFLFLGLPQLYVKISHTYIRLVLAMLIALSLISNILAGAKSVVNCQFENNVWQNILTKQSIWLTSETPYLYFSWIGLFIILAVLAVKLKFKKL